jgi:ATP-binding cassette, subfamily B, bacterial HlyB/CyaB
MDNQSDLKSADAGRSTALAALARIGAHHGLTLDMDQLRRTNPYEGNEPTPAVLARIAERAGFDVRRMKVGRGDLAKIKRVVPAILFLRSGKVALLSRVKTGGGAPCALLADLEGQGGASALFDEPRLFEVWGGEVMLLKRRWRLTDEERPFDFAWLIGQALREKRLFRDIGVAAFLMSFLVLAPPLTFMTMIDRVLYNHSMPTLMVLGLMLLMIISFDTVFGYLRRRLTVLATSRIDARISLHVFDKLLNLPLAFFERSSTGTTNSKIGQIWHIRKFLTEVVCGTMLDGVSLLVLLPVLFFLNWKLACFVIALAFVILLVYILYLPALRARHKVVILAEQNLFAHQVETIYGIRTVKSLSLDGLKRFQRDRFVAELVEAKRAFEFLENAPQTLVMPFERLIYAGTFFIGCYMALNDPTGATIGSVVAFAMLSGRVTAPIVQMAGLINSYEYARGAMSEVASVMNTPPEEGRSGKGLRQPIAGRVTFQDVRFRYKPGASYALDGVSFDIPKGTIFGIMGRSGSGKTTVTRLLQGLSRDYEGLIKLDSMDLRAIDLDHLRSNIGVVPQENFLFSGTIHDNISAARPKASFEKVVRAAQMAGAEEFIERLPNGYSTVVEEGAVNFSGGQRQRLAIARALLTDPPILVLDEATSALDAESEAIVNANLMRIAMDRTVIIVSHRLSSLVTADAILVMERGRFYDLGRHEELVERCDIYKSLWHQQNRHLDLEGRHAPTEARSASAA